MKGIITIPKSEYINRQLNVDNTNGFRLPSSATTPFIALQPGSKSLLVKGNSSPENPLRFYEKLSIVIERYLNTGVREFTINFYLNFINTGSAKCLFELMLSAQHEKNMGLALTVNWYYNFDDVEMLKFGEKFSSYSKLNLNLIAVTTN